MTLKFWWPACMNWLRSLVKSLFAFIMPTLTERLETAISLLEGDVATLQSIIDEGWVGIGAVVDAPLASGTWLEMNGQVVAQATYPKLFKLIGHKPEFAWTVSKRLSSFAVSCVAYGGGVYVVAGSSGDIWTSTDRLNWTERTSGFGDTINGVEWDPVNSLFIVVADANKLATSPDGITWTLQTTGFGSTINIANVVHANGRNIICGSNGAVAHSTNGTTWTVVSPNPAAGFNLNIILYQHGVYFICPSTGFTQGIVYSTNGTSWNYVAKPTISAARLIGFDATYFYLVDTNSCLVYRSTDGASWAEIVPGDNSMVHGAVTYLPIVFNNGTIVLSEVGNYTVNGYSSLAQFIFESSIGLAAPLVNPWGNAAVKFAIVQAGSSSNRRCYSVDGKTWTPDIRPGPMSTPATAPANHRTFVNGYYFIFVSSYAMVISAPAPYDPSTHFQIPTRTDAAGNPLHIRALI